MVRVLDFGKFSALGLYVALDDLTIVCHAHHSLWLCHVMLFIRALLIPTDPAPRNEHPPCPLGPIPPNRSQQVLVLRALSVRPGQCLGAVFRRHRYRQRRREQGQLQVQGQFQVQFDSGQAVVVDSYEADCRGCVRLVDSRGVSGVDGSWERSGWGGDGGEYVDLGEGYLAGG